ncbi:ROK family protein [Catenulispora sp. GP43]|uniref:ROK family protein n=1 Tax=Catenulispora sp. GP43 TaxID=3156263 RepID=UPI0035126CD0
MPKQPGAAARTPVTDRSSIRPGNLGLILRRLRDDGPRSRTALAADTGLPKATISSLVTELADLGLVREGDPQRGEGAVGRPRLAVELDGRGVCGIGVEINADYVAAIALDLRGRTVFERRAAADVPALGAAGTLDVVGRLTAEAITQTRSAGIRPLGMTIAAPGGADPATGSITTAVNLGWRDVPVVAPLRERFGADVPLPPIAIRNDAHVATVAEYVAVAGAGVRDLLYVTGEMGVGGGVYNGGQPYHGARGRACEFGHMPINPEPVACPCGRVGCWETMVGLGAFLDHATDSGDIVRDPLTDRERRLAELHRRAESGDERTLGALREIAAGLGRGVALLVDAFDPELVVLGGYFTQFADYLLEPVQRAIDERILNPSTGRCEVRPSTHRYTSTVRGGAQFALEPVFQDPVGTIGRSPAL